MKRKTITLFLLISGALAVYSQDEASRLLNLLDSVLNTAAEVGKAAPSSSSSPPSAPAEGNPTFNILNKTGFIIKSISITQADSGDETSITLNGNLYNGQSARVSLTVPLSVANRYDIRLVDVDGDQYAKQNVEITDFAIIEVRINDFEN
jgi:hypothetical protein